MFQRKLVRRLNVLQNRLRTTLRKIVLDSKDFYLQLSADQVVIAHDLGVRIGGSSI